MTVLSIKGYYKECVIQTFYGLLKQDKRTQ
jgi:hypothetical protein